MGRLICCVVLCLLAATPVLAPGVAVQVSPAASAAPVSMSSAPPPAVRRTVRQPLAPRRPRSLPTAPATVVESSVMPAAAPAASHVFASSALPVASGLPPLDVARLDVPSLDVPPAILMPATVASSLVSTSASVSSRLSARPPALVPMYVSFATLQGLDYVSTTRAISSGAGREANPIMKPVVGNRAAFVAVKAGATAGTIWMAERMRKKHPVRAVVFMVATNVAMATIVAHNYSVTR